MSDVDPSGPSGVSKDERTWAMVAHLIGIIGFLGPLIVWLIQREKMPFVDDQGKESLNFQLTVLIAWLISGVLSCFAIGLFVIPVIFLGNIILCILAALKANEGVAYRYPVIIRMIK